MLVDSPYRAKFRTGGVVPGAFPDEDELAGFLTGCAQRGLPYKCTAGLHHAVRHTDPVTGFEHHGFLNVLLAAAETDRKAAAEVLAERSGEVLAASVRELTDRQVTVIRNSFTAFGTCSIAEPLADLAGLGLVAAPAAAPSRTAASGTAPQPSPPSPPHAPTASSTSTTSADSPSQEDR